MIDINSFSIVFSMISIMSVLVFYFNAVINLRRFLFVFILVGLPLLIYQSVYLESFFGLLIGLINIILYYILIPLISLNNISKKAIIYAMLFYVCATGAIIISVLWIESSLNINESVQAITDMLLELFFCVIVIILRNNRTIKAFTRTIVLLPKHIKISLLGYIFIASTIASFLSDFSHDYPDTLDMKLIQILTASCLIFIGILLPILVSGGISNMYFKKTVDNAERQMREQVARYEQSIRKNEEIRKFRHDFKNMQVGLVSLLEKNDVENALKIIRDFDSTIRFETAVFETGNHVADALLAEKSAKGAISATIIKCETQIPDAYISYIDICILLGNAIDNAIEACEKIDGEKTVEVKTLLNNGFFFITVENPVAQDVVINNNFIASTKIDKSNHGLGLLSIMKTAKKYDGVLKLSCENKSFILALELDLHKFL